MHITVKGKNLSMGDTVVEKLPDGIEKFTRITYIADDIDGMWIEFEDGDEGYTNPNGDWLIVDYADEL